MSEFGTEREESKRVLKFGAGNYKFTALELPGGFEFGVELVGEGVYSTQLLFDGDNANPGIFARIEGVNFRGMTLRGAISAGGTRKGVIYRGQKTNNTLDVDVRFGEDTRLTDAEILVQAYGRGVAILGVASLATQAILEIVADINAVFGTIRNRS